MIIRGARSSASRFLSTIVNSASRYVGSFDGMESTAVLPRQVSVAYSGCSSDTSPESAAATGNSLAHMPGSNRSNVFLWMCAVVNRFERFALHSVPLYWRRCGA